MANFVSVQTGDFNDGATWGNTSPGTRGIDWPGLADDTFTVTNGHTVTYNVSESAPLGQIDVAGKLSFDDGGYRFLLLGQADLNVANGGELEIGTSGSNFAANRIAEILWDPFFDNSKGLQIADGGKLTIYGASDYCTVYEDTLADDTENTDGDKVIKTVTDMSADWHGGDELMIKTENVGNTTSYKNAVKRAVIQSFAGQLITLDIDITAETGVGDTWVAPVVNVTRNVRLGKLDADVACGDGSTHYNTDRPYFRDTNADGNNNCVFSHAMATGFIGIRSDYDFQFLNSVVRNGEYGFYLGAGHTISGNICANYSGLSDGSDHGVSGNICANWYGFTGGDGYTVSADVYANRIAFATTSGYVTAGNVYGNYHGFALNDDTHAVSADVYANYIGFVASSYATVSGDVHTNSYGFIGGYSNTVSGGVHDNVYGFYTGAGYEVTGDVSANFYGFHSGVNYTVSGDVYDNDYGFYGGTGCTVSGNVYGNTNGFRNGFGHKVSGNVYANDYGFYGGTDYVISGRIGYTSGDVSQPNTVFDISPDVDNDRYSKHTLLNAKLPLAGLSVKQNAFRVVTRVMCEHHNRVTDAHKIYDNTGDVVKVVCDGGGDRPSEDPDGGNADCIELSNIQSVCNSNNPLKVWEEHQYRILVAAFVLKTYTFKVQTTYAGISANRLKLTAKYLDEGSGGHLGEQINAPAISQRASAADWSQTLAVTVNPSQTGWIDFMIELTEHEPDNEVWIWPEIGIS